MYIDYFATVFFPEEFFPYLQYHTHHSFKVHTIVFVYSRSCIPSTAFFINQIISLLFLLNFYYFVVTFMIAFVLSLLVFNVSPLQSPTKEPKAPSLYQVPFHQQQAFLPQTPTLTPTAPTIAGASVLLSECKGP